MAGAVERENENGSSMSELFILQCDGCGTDATTGPQVINAKARVRVPPGWAAVWVGTGRGQDPRMAHFCSPECWLDTEKRAA
jgi:hypothetical protein